MWRVPCKRGSSKEVSLDAIKTSNFSPSVLFGDWFVGTYAIVKIRGAKLIGTDKTCHSKFPCSKQEKKNVYVDNIYHSEPYTTHQTSDADRTSAMRATSSPGLFP